MIGHVKGATIGTDGGDEGDMSQRGEGPDAIANRKDGNGADTRGFAYGQAGAFRVGDPVGGIAPVARQIIAQVMPLLPGPPDAVAAAWCRARAESIGIAVG